MFERFIADSDILFAAEIMVLSCRRCVESEGGCEILSSGEMTAPARNAAEEPHPGRV